MLAGKKRTEGEGVTKERAPDASWSVQIILRAGESEFHPQQVQQQNSPGYPIAGCSLPDGECSCIPSIQQASFWTPSCRVGNIIWQQLAWHDMAAATPLSLSRKFSGTEVYVEVRRLCCCFSWITNLLLQVRNGQAPMLDPSFCVRRELPQRRRKINTIPPMKSTN